MLKKKYFGQDSKFACNRPGNEQRNHNILYPSLKLHTKYHVHFVLAENSIHQRRSIINILNLIYWHSSIFSSWLQGHSVWYKGYTGWRRTNNFR